MREAHNIRGCYKAKLGAKLGAALKVPASFLEMRAQGQQPGAEAWQRHRQLLSCQPAPELLPVDPQLAQSCAQPACAWTPADSRNPKQSSIGEMTMGGRDRNKTCKGTSAHLTECSVTASRGSGLCGCACGGCGGCVILAAGICLHPGREKVHVDLHVAWQHQHAHNKPAMQTALHD